MTSTLGSVTDGQLCDDSGVSGCAPKIVVQDGAAKTVTVSNPTNVVTQAGGARITASPSNTQVVTTSQSPQVVVNSSATTVINTGCCTSDGGVDIGGADTQVQFNDAGLLEGDPTFVFDKDTDRLRVQNLAADSITIIENGDVGGAGQRTEINPFGVYFYATRGDFSANSYAGAYGTLVDFVNDITGESSSFVTQSSGFYFLQVDDAAAIAKIEFSPGFAEHSSGHHVLTTPFKTGTIARIEDVIGPLLTPTYPSAFNVADLPDPADYPRAVAVAIDAVPGAALCLSDGADWINVTTGLAVVGP